MAKETKKEIAIPENADITELLKEDFSWGKITHFDKEEYQKTIGALKRRTKRNR